SVTLSGRRPAVLVEDPTKPIAALDAPGRQWDHVGRLTGSALLDPLVWPGVVVVVDVLSQHLVQMPAAEDQHVVQNLTPGGAHPALRKCVRHWPPVGQADDLHALALEHLVECRRELRVPIAKQELGPQGAVLELPSQVARLLDHPLRSRVIGAAGEMNSAAAHLYKEEDVEPGQPDRVHGDEIRGQDLAGVLTNELAPGALASPRCWLQAMAAEHLADGEVGTAVAQFAQLAHDPPVAPTFVFPRQLENEVVQLAPDNRPMSAGLSPIS